MALQDNLCTGAFGLMGSGKTIDLVATGRMAVVAGNAQNVLSAKSWLGVQPPMPTPMPRTIYEVQALIRQLGEQYGAMPDDKRPIDGIGVDDLTIISKQTELWLREGNPHPKTKQKVDLKNYSDLWTRLQNDLFETVDIARACRLHVFFNGHERKARTNNAGKFFRGGIDLPMDSTESFSALLDFAGRCQQGDDSYLPLHIHWRVGYWCKNFDQNWATKSRIAGTPDFIPQNLGELVRLAQRTDTVKTPMRRWPGREWHEDWVAAATEQLLQAGTDKAIQRQIFQRMFAKLTEQGKTDVDKWWIARDAEDRVYLERARTVNRLGNYFAAA